MRLHTLAILALLAVAALPTPAAAAKKASKRADARAASKSALSAAVLKTLLADEPNLRLHELGEISDSEEYRTRAYLGEAHQQAAALITKWMKGAGLTTRVDAVGNLRGVLAGNGTAGGRRWLTGSHFDTAPDAGAYDGPLGVVLSIAVVEASIAEAAVAKGLTTSAKLAKALAAGKRVKDVLPSDVKLDTLLSKGVEVVAFADEEGVRFGGPLASSKALIGAYEPEGLLNRIDAKNVTVKDALAKVGIDATPAALAAAVIPGDEIEGFIEAHVEGFDKLEKIGSPVGIVTHVAGATHIMFNVEGPERLLVSWRGGGGGKGGGRRTRRPHHTTCHSPRTHYTLPQTIPRPTPAPSPSLTGPTPCLQRPPSSPPSRPAAPSMALGPPTASCAAPTLCPPSPTPPSTSRATST